MTTEEFLNKLDDLVDKWHKGYSAVPLRNFLGMSDSDYAKWIFDPKAYAENLSPEDLDKIENL